MLPYVVLASAVLLAAVHQYKRSKEPSHPPGPKGYPLIGNLFDVPHHDVGRVYRDWTPLYGPIIYMHVFGREFVVLNTAKVVSDLLDKRSGNYSSRPRWVMAGELVGRFTNSVLFTPYGKRLRSCRQLLHSWLSQRVVNSYIPLQTLGVYKFMEDLLHTPEDFFQHFRSASGMVILKMTYGIDCAPANDPWIAMSEELGHITTHAGEPGRWLVDSFPWLAYIPTWFPGAGFKRWALEARKTAINLVYMPYQKVKSEVLTGKAPPSLVASGITSKGGASITHDNETSIAMCSGSIYAGGIDTVFSLITTFILIMTRHPDVQGKAQAELDQVVGPDRLPTLEDKENLPYLECVVKECFRINAIAPLVPHSPSEDDVYEGYIIKKGTWILTNTWALLNDPEVYPNPSQFDPSRFSGPNPQTDPRLYSFGFGRRHCPGMHFAETTIFLNVSHLLWMFRFGPKKDEVTGEEMMPEFKYHHGHLSFPEPFKCDITPRDPSRVPIFREAHSQAQQVPATVSLDS